MTHQVRRYIGQRCLFQPGDRVAVAVSGGADSVALLRVMLELRDEQGIVLSVAHFHHGIRGQEADADQQFVRELAEKFGLELHAGAADAPAFARAQKISLETAARDLRHRWFAELIQQSKVDKIATAHTLDDQAETVLMRLLRGAGSRGLAGIFPMQEEKRLVRPLLTTTRREIEHYLTDLSQPWREDSSNRDLAHTRNRVRHELLPLLEQDFNPAIRQLMADLAEVSRAEADYWDKEVASLLPKLVRPRKPSRSGRTTSREASHTLAIDLASFRVLPSALQRQVLLRIAQRLGIGLEFIHVQQLIQLAQGKNGSPRLVLPGRFKAVRSFRELQLSPPPEDDSCQQYQYSLPIPGEVAIPELGTVIRARLVAPGKEAGEYNSRTLLDRTLLAPELTVRNWRAGDRFFPAHTRTPKKLKELLQAGRMGEKLSLVQRKIWPVIESSGQIVWVRGLPVAQTFAAGSGAGRAHIAVLIEETDLSAVTEDGNEQ